MLIFFLNIEKWVPSIDFSLLKTEYITFSLTELLEGFHPNKLHTDKTAIENDLCSVILTSLSNEDIEVVKEKVSSLKVLEILSGYRLTATFPNLYLAYEFLCTYHHHYRQQNAAFGG